MLLIQRRYLAVLLALSVSLWWGPALLAQDAGAPADEPAADAGDAVAPADAPAAADAPPAADAPAAADEPVADKAAKDKPAAADKPEDLLKLWTDLSHYIRVARPDLAVTYAEKVLESGFDDREIYRMTINVKGSRADLIRARGLEGMKAAVDKLLAVIERGYEDERSDPAEIARQIERLGGLTRAHRNATRRLIVSGEYAVPQLIQKLRDTKTSETLRPRIVGLLEKLGKDAVRALSVALQTDNPKLQKVLAEALGEIGYPHAAPRLKELLAREDLVKNVRRAARDALAACAGEAALRKTPAELFYGQALRYYYRAQSVRADPRYEKANVWYWRDDLGATYKPVPRQIFCDVYAMRMSRLALRHDPKYYSAIWLWLSAIVRKEADLPDGAKDPTWAAGRRGAKFYMLAASAKYQQHVLARALHDKDSAVARAAIEALAETAGAKSLVKPIAGGAQPLVSALTYADIRVRMLAAVSLARALPDGPFAGSDLVMPVLNQALRVSGAKRAVLLSDDEEVGNRVKGILRAADWQVLHEPDVKRTVVAARAVSGVDLVVLARTKDPQAVLRRLRKQAVFVMVPMAVLPGDTDRVAHLPKSYPRCVVIAADANDEVVKGDIARAARMGDAGAVGREEGGRWAIDAADAVRTLGLTGGRVFDIQRTRAALSEALNDPRAEVRLAAAGALASMPSAAAQQAISGLALNGAADEPVRVAAMRHCTESVRRFGKMITDQQAQAVLEIVQDKANSAALRDAAAQLLGSLDLPSERIMSLIVETGAK